MAPPKVSLALLPNAQDIEFMDSSFFKQENPKLPKPSQVRSDAAKWEDELLTTLSRPPPVFYQELNLLVKYGSAITIAEGQCLWFIHRHLSPDVPVPEIYGWHVDGDETFLYMELIKGDTLEHRWDGLSETDRTAICAQLRSIVSAWRRLSQDSVPEFIGQLGGQALRDQLFYTAFVYPAGPFPNIVAFHDWFARLAFKTRPDLFSREKFELSGLSDEEPVVFTHGDLHRSNIMISSTGDGPPRVIAVLDWHQSGWYPLHWEFLKAMWTTDIHGEWPKKYIPQFLEPASLGYWRAFEWTRLTLGC